jgi:glutamate--glyoxylate aminotransferase
MCVLCHARKAKSLGKLLTTASRNGSYGGPAAVVEGRGSNFVATRVFSAVPQPADSPTAGRVDGYVLHPTTLNPDILKAQYAVRGELYNKAVDLAAKGREIIYTNGGCGRL